ncbi:hypothetical protein T484DRAFT_1780119 [Baffinella frigidus]|nr:hypothetical protein T484DRAFT_1780119 [Cryptophyta sp. CCMP2293]
MAKLALLAIAVASLPYASAFLVPLGTAGMRRTANRGHALLMQQDPATPLLRAPRAGQLHRLQGGLEAGLRRRGGLTQSRGAGARVLTRRSNSHGSAPAADGEEYILYQNRWVQLGLLSLLALLSDWACFAAVGGTKEWTSQFHHNPEELIDLFLITNGREGA